MKKTLSLRGRAIALLARREHSRAELGRKLRPHLQEGDSQETLEALLDDLVGRKLQSDERYAEARAHALGGKFGSARIAYDLRMQGVNEAVIDGVVGKARREDFSRAQAVWKKRFGEAPKDAAEHAKQARFLAARGFSTEIIRKLLRGLPDE